MIRAKLQLVSELHDRGIAPPVLSLRGHAADPARGLTVRLAIEISGGSARQLEDLEGAIHRRLEGTIHRRTEVEHSAVLSVLSSSDARGAPLISAVYPISVPNSEVQSNAHRRLMAGARPGALRYAASPDPCWPGGPTGKSVRAHRIGKDMSQSDVATMLGIEQPTISALELGIPGHPFPEKLRAPLLNILSLNERDALSTTSTTLSPDEISSARKAAGIKALTLAHRLGVCEQTVYAWERGVNNPRPSTLRRLRQALGLDKPAPGQYTDAA